MGALPGAGCVAFRVWGRHAEKVFVTGTFNDWSKASTPLVGEKNGYWFAEVPEAKRGMNTDTHFPASVDKASLRFEPWRLAEKGEAGPERLFAIGLRLNGGNTPAALESDYLNLRCLS
jgi:hypothetical protein